MWPWRWSKEKRFSRVRAEVAKIFLIVWSLVLVLLSWNLWTIVFEFGFVVVFVPFFFLSYQASHLKHKQWVEARVSQRSVSNVLAHKCCVRALWRQQLPQAGTIKLSHHPRKQQGSWQCQGSPHPRNLSGDTDGLRLGQDMACGWVQLDEAHEQGRALWNWSWSCCSLSRTGDDRPRAGMGAWAFASGGALGIG